LRKEYSQALCYKITDNIVVALDHTLKLQHQGAGRQSLRWRIQGEILLEGVWAGTPYGWWGI